MTRSDRLRRSEGGLYVADGVEVPDYGIVLRHGIVVRFGLGGTQPVTLLDPGTAGVEPLVELVGGDAATGLVDLAERVEVAHPRPYALQLAARGARALGVLRLPVARSQRHRWRAQAVMAAGDLVDLGLATTAMMHEQGAALLAGLGQLGPEALDAVRSSRWVMAALRRLDAALDDPLPLGVSDGDQEADALLGAPAVIGGDERQILEDLIDDLPEPDLLLVARLEEEAAVGAASGVDDRPPVATVSQLTPQWLADDEQQHPLLWQLVREELLPDDHGFDGAVRVRMEGGTARIEVAAHPGHAEVLFVRIVDGAGELRSVDVLRPTDGRWVGDIALPEDFDRRTERFEITDSLSRDIVDDPARAVDEQRDLVELAWALVDSDT